MSKIHILDSETIDHIAAGEVVERPLSVVKELVENSIDAGSSAITVEIKGGGIEFIRVTDNGSGIEADQADVAFMRHATSKIESKNDLLSIHSLGFRGEALSSICAVSKVELITKTNDCIYGLRYVINGGKKVESKEIGAPEGTTFVIRELFYNTPARREFLKTATTEGRVIEECMIHFALSHPNIRWQFINEGKNKLQTSGDGDLKTSIYQSFGMELSKSIIPIEAEDEGIRLFGFIGKPEFSRGNKSYMNYYVNSRYIKSKVVSAAILDGYRDFLMNHRFPFTAIMLDINPESIDVNVHPTKLEVRFSNEKKVYELIYDTIKNALNNITLIPAETLDAVSTPMSPLQSPGISDRGNSIINDTIKQTYNSERLDSRSEADNINNTGDNETGLNSSDYNSHTNNTTGSNNNNYIRGQLQDSNLGSSRIQKPLKVSSVQPFEQNRMQIEPVPVRDIFPDEKSRRENEEFTNTNVLKTEDKKQFRIIGQIFETYWMIEYKNELLIIDQHAAHEKVLYEQFVNKMKNKVGMSQEILAPIVVSLSGREQSVFEENKEIFEQLGFSLESFGEREYIIKAIPADFLNVPPKELFLDILDTYTSEQRGKKPEMVLDHLATMACKAAVKGNNLLSYPEVEELISRMLELDEPYHCPHGRPTTISFSKYDLEKRFKRIV